MDLPTLVGSEKVAGAADLQVAHGDAEPRSQFVRFQYRVDAFAGRLAYFLVVGQQQVGVGPVVSTAHSPTQLVQLCQPKAVGPVDDDRVHVGHVQARLDDRGADQHVRLSVGERHHHLFQFRLRHLPVAHEYVGFRDEFPQLLRDVVDGPHPIVQEEHLPIPLQLAKNRLTHRLGAVLRDESLYRQPRFRWSVDHAHVPHPRQRHVQRPGDRSCAQRHHVDFGPHLFQALLVRHSEPMLLVDDHQPQVFKPHVLLQDAVGADHDVHHAGLRGLHHLFLLFMRSEPAQDRDLDRIGSQPFRECGVMLLRQHRGRYQHRHLHSLIDRFERRPQRDFGFAVAHVPANQAVHGLVVFHVILDFVDRLHLVRRFLVRERVLKVLLPRGVGTEAMSVHRFPDRVEPE